MKKYSKLIVAAVIILVFIATFVFLYQKSQPAPIEYSELTPVTTDIIHHLLPAECRPAGNQNAVCTS